MTDKDIGLQIKKARTDAKMSQSELGKKLGVTWEMISRYENGRSSARKYLDSLAKFLDKPVGYFLGVEVGQANLDLDKLVDKLKGSGLGQTAEEASKVVLIDDFSILGFERSLKLTRQYYSVPNWINEKYEGVFALRLGSAIPEALDTNKGDIGYFTKVRKPQVGDVVLVKSGSVYKLQRFSTKLKGDLLAVLIAQEKRFL